MFLTINFYWASRDGEKDLIFSATKTFEQTREYMEYILSEIDVTMNQITFNDLVQQALKLDPLSYSEDKTLQVSYANDLSQLFHSTTTYPISHISLYLQDETDLSKEQVTFFSFKEAKASSWYQRVDKEEAISIWYPPEYFSSSENKKTLSVVRKVLSNQNYNLVLGMVRFEVPITVFSTLLNKVNITQHSTTILYNRYGETICTSDNSFLGTKTFNKELNELFPEQNYPQLVFEKGVINNKKQLIGTVSIKSTDWKMALIIPEEDILSSYLKSRNSMIFVVILVIPFSFILAYWLTYTNTKNISMLISHMRRVVNGNFNIEILPSGKDETGELIRNYNFMLTKISMLLEEKFSMGRQIKSLELKSLQAQINPHFLYNTLDLINCIARDSDTPQISDLVKTLSKFYRLSLSNGQDIVPLQNELDHIQHYVKIQNMRFEGCIHLAIDVTDDYTSVLLPKLTLQPIVENAILHGILEREDATGHIWITARKEEENILIISIKDDGVGIPREKLANIFNRIESSTTGGFGIYNIHERLILFFGEGYGLSYESVQGEGTTVMIHIPLNSGYLDNVQKLHIPY